MWRFRISRTMSVRAVLVRLSVEQVCCQSQGVSLSLRSCLYLYYCVRFSTSNPETTDAWLITEIYGYLKHLLGKNTSLKYMRRRYDFWAVWVWNMRISILTILNSCRSPVFFVTIKHWSSLKSFVSPWELNSYTVGKKYVNLLSSDRRANQLTDDRITYK